MVGVSSPAPYLAARESRLTHINDARCSMLIPLPQWLVSSIDAVYHQQYYTMAEVIGLASGIVALSVFAIESSTKLFEIINSFENHTRNVQHLQHELASLGGVLKSLQETVDSDDVDLSALKLPLLHCGKACGDFTAIVAKCSSSSSSVAKDTRTSFRDWFRLKYLGKDVAGFTNLLAGYKATIMIALGDANM